jgi:hypothetical protein
MNDVMNKEQKAGKDHLETQKLENGRTGKWEIERMGDGRRETGDGAPLGLVLDTYLVIIMFYMPRNTSDLPKVLRTCPSRPKVVHLFPRPFLAFPILHTMSCPCPFDFAGAFLI